MTYVVKGDKKNLEKKILRKNKEAAFFRGKIRDVKSIKV